MKRILLVLPIVLLLYACKESQPVPGPRFGIETGLLGDSAMVVASRAEAAQAGRDILYRGGNAIDAAVAVQFALAVTFPYAGNIGGGGFMVYRQADGQAYALDFREKAPAAAYRDMYLDENGDPVPEMSQRGHLAVGVPGTVDGLWQAHQRFGKLPWSEVLEPAVRLALQGYEATEMQADWLNKVREDFLRYNPDGAYLVKDEGWKAGDSIFQTDLGHTLQLISEQGRAGFYEGPTAERIVDEMQRGNGLITLQDLSGYHAQWREPIAAAYKDFKVISMPPPSSGGVALVQMLKMIEDQPIADWGFRDPRTIHLLVEAERRAFADRAEYLGDPDFYPVPLAALTDPAYARQRMESFDPAQATPSSELGHGALRPEPTETSHFSIVDLEGNAVSITITLNSAYGSRVWVKDAGFLLNNEMDDFSAKPGVPNQFGLVGNEANAIAGGKRMLSSMTPTIIERKGKLYMVIGTPGGSTIITSVLQCFLNVAEFGMTMRESVDQLRYHHQWLPDLLYHEAGAFDSSTVAALAKLGHVPTEREPIGRVDAILVRPDGLYEGAGDHRRDDVAIGF